MELGSIRAAVRAAMPRTLTVLGELVALPTVFADRAGSAAYDRCARRICDELVLLGFEEVNAEPLSDGSSCVVARLRCGTDAPTVLLYSHFDVQPVGEVDRWHSDPFELTERDGRLYGRGAADCKGGVVALLAAVRAVSDEVRCNIVFVCEGSEEAGGAGLERLMASQPGRFADVDVALVLDGVNPAPGVPAIVDSMRGVAGVRVGVRTATAPLHAGTFGGAVPDANVVLTRLLASLWHDDGATVFDAPEGPTETVDAQALAEFATSNGLLPGVAVVGAGPLEDRTARRFAIAILATDLPPMVDLVPVLRPSAEAILSVRTPPGVSTAAAVERLRTHLRRHVLWGAELTCELRHLSDPFESVRGRAHALMRTALTHAFDAPVVQVRTGGTVPLCASLARAATGAEVILFGVADETSAIHSLDESIGVDDLESVIVAVAAFLLAYAEEEPMSAP